MDGWLGMLFLIVITTICFIAFVTSTGDARKSFMASSFIAFGLAIFLRAMSLIPDLAMFVTLVATALAVGFSFIGQNK